MSTLFFQKIIKQTNQSAKAQKANDNSDSFEYSLERGYKSFSELIRTLLEEYIKNNPTK